MDPLTHQNLRQPYLKALLLLCKQLLTQHNLQPARVPPRVNCRVLTLYMIDSHPLLLGDGVKLLLEALGCCPRTKDLRQPQLSHVLLLLPTSCYQIVVVT